MNQTPLKTFLASFFSTLLKAMGGAFVAHRLVSPEAASGLLSYADPLAALILVGAGQVITMLKDEKFRARIAHDAELIESLISHKLEPLTHVTGSSTPPEIKIINQIPK